MRKNLIALTFVIVAAVGLVGACSEKAGADQEQPRIYNAETNNDSANWSVRIVGQKIPGSDELVYCVATEKHSPDASVNLDCNWDAYNAKVAK